MIQFSRQLLDLTVNSATHSLRWCYFSMCVRACVCVRGVCVCVCGVVFNVGEYRRAMVGNAPVEFFDPSNQDAIRIRK